MRSKIHGNQLRVCLTLQRKSQCSLFLANRNIQVQSYIVLRLYQLLDITRRFGKVLDDWCMGNKLDFSKILVLAVKGQS